VNEPKLPTPIIEFLVVASFCICKVDVKEAFVFLIHSCGVDAEYMILNKPLTTPPVSLFKKVLVAYVSVIKLLTIKKWVWSWIY
jgi:hypothetical protein